MELPEHLSFSQINTYMRCPKQYEFSYIQKLKQAPAFALDFGKAVHKGLEANYEQKIQTKTDLPVQEIQAHYDASLRLAKQTVKETAEKQYRDEWDETYKKAKDMGLTMLENYQNIVGSVTQPEFVEQKFVIEREYGRPIIGYIDLIDDMHVVRDTKTSAKKYSQGQADTDMQLTLYSYATQKVLGIKPSGVQFDVLVKTKTPQVQSVSSRRTKKQLDEGLAVALAVEEEIQMSFKRGFFTPRPNPMHCGWCGYNKICPFGKGYVKNN